MPKLSPAPTSKLTPSCTSCAPKRLTMSRTEMTGSAMASEIDLEIEHREHRVGEDDQEDRLHDGNRREPAELARRLAHLQPAQCPGQRAQRAEDRRLAH